MHGAVLALAAAACASAAFALPASSEPTRSGAAAMTALSSAVATAAAAANARALAAGSSVSSRMAIGALLEAIEKPLRAVWDAASAAEQAAAKARAVAPLAGRTPGVSPTPLPNPLPGPYYRMLPELLGNALIDGSPLRFASPCFAVNTAVGALSADGATLTVNLTSSAPQSPQCADLYWLATVDWMDFVLVNASAAVGGVLTSSATFPVSARPGAAEWVGRKGAMVMRFLDGDILTNVWAALTTISLFIPALITSPIAPADAQRTLDFLRDYVNVTMPVRAAPNVTLDASLFASGDLLLVHRPDGLGSLEQWGTGARTTHVVMFMRDAQGELWVVESQSNGADWPIDRIQKNSWAAWQAMAYQASYGWIWLPMRASARAAFDEAKAWSYINSTLGVNYGYQDFATTFYDTEFSNLPWPTRPEQIEVLLGVLEGLLGDLILVEGAPLVNILFTQTLQQRLARNFSASFLITAEEIAASNATLGQVLASVEQDAFAYPMRTGVGPTAVARVCDAYACAVHKAAGSFGALADQINCADFHNTGALGGGGGVGLADSFSALPTLSTIRHHAAPSPLHSRQTSTRSTSSTTLPCGPPLVWPRTPTTLTASSRARGVLRLLAREQPHLLRT